MTAQLFLKRYGIAKVNKPSYRGAKMPSFDETKINESVFPDELRDKDVNILIDDGFINIHWLSQEWNNNTKDFFEEVFRCYRYLAKVHNLEEPIKIEVIIENRDGVGYDYAEKLIEV